MADRAGCTARRHGTYIAYQRDGCRCAAATADWRRYRKRWQAGHRRTVPAVGTARRLQALAAIGWSSSALAAHTGRPSPEIFSWLRRGGGRVYRTTADWIAGVYDELCMTPRPCGRTRSHALRAGWAPPLAWDDIDDPGERPKVARRVVSGGAPDPGEVEAILTRRMPLAAAQLASRDEALRLLHHRMPDASAPQIAAFAQCGERSVTRWRARHRARAAAGAGGEQEGAA